MVGFVALDFVHGANAADPKKLRLPMVNEGNMQLSREVKIT